jgi:hypothetical protein
LFSIILGAFLVLVALVIAVVVPPAFPRKAIAAAIILLGSVISLSGSVSYNDAGYCSHIRTIFGSETSKCDLGWYFSGWGSATQWPHNITVGNVSDPAAIKTDSISTYLTGPHRVKLADNWAGDITQSTRFAIPLNEEKFLKMARDFRTPENLIASTLLPSVKASLDSTSNLFTMEEYYSGGQRDAFKNEYRDTITYGPAATEQIRDEVEIKKRVAPSATDAVADKSENSTETNIVIVEKKTDKNGKDIRPIEPGYKQYGINITTAIIENLDPDNAYEAQVVKRKEALGQRVIARDQRITQEEQRLLKVAEAQTEIAEEQGKAQKDQIKQTTNAETTKKLALIAADQQLQSAEVTKKTAQISFEKAEIDAKAQIVKAEADAKERQLAIEADNALQTKINAEIEIQKAWADAYARRAVPHTVFGGGGEAGAPVGSDGEVRTFFNLMNAQAAKTLSYDRTVEPVGSEAKK